MDTPVIMPQLGNVIEEAQIDGWMKSIGDDVIAGETLLSVTTPKVSIEIEAPISGKLTQILIEADELASVGATLAIISS
jgi:pyruvate/2-oxoglutarate dehydrogenase complex dihydrolipoamide acyltransferase (E2) component